MQIITNIDARGRIYLPKKFRIATGLIEQGRYLVRVEGNALVIELKKKKNVYKTTNARRRAGEEVRKIRVFQKGNVDYKELINYGRKYL